MAATIILYFCSSVYSSLSITSRILTTYVLSISMITSRGTVYNRNDTIVVDLYWIAIPRNVDHMRQ